MSNRPVNGPSTTGNKSGGNRGNALPKVSPPPAPAPAVPKGK